MMKDDLEMEHQADPSGLTAEAVALMLDMGICPGNDCPYAAGRCDPRCPALVAWVEQTSMG